jgi:intein/homing endonuclease
MFRAKFTSKDTQISWFQIATQKLTVADIASLCNSTERTVRDWKRSKFNPEYDCIKKICDASALPFPKVQQICRYGHTKTAGKKGGLCTKLRYGGMPLDEKTRKKMWYAWWEKIGKYTHTLPTQPHKIKKPRKSIALAEFIGIMMGDGTVSHYHIGITLNATDDKEYVRYVSKLIKRLFDLAPKIYKRKNKNAVVLTVARKLLVDYLHGLGLPIGNKIRQNLDIPAWIRNNPRYARACVRGLMDTDGSVFLHSYTSKDKIYAYKKFSFTSASPILLQTVHHILSENNVRSNVSGTNLRIGSIASVRQYVSIINTHNPKHLKRLVD